MSDYTPLLPIDTRLSMRGTRLQDRFRVLCALSDTFSISAAVVGGTEPDLSPIQPILLRGKCSIGIAVPRITTFRMAVLGSDPGDLAIQITRGIRDWPHAAEISFEGVQELFDLAAAAQFLLYYETHIDWVKKRAGNSVANYLYPWGFAWVVRNAISHANVIRIDDTTFAPISWAHLIYGPGDSGRCIIGPELEMPDLMLLMLDMDVALENAGFDLE